MANNPRILTLGWDFPPHITGGLGVAVAGLSHAIDQLGGQVTMVLPRAQKVDSHLPFVFAEHFEVSDAAVTDWGSQSSFDLFSAYGTSRSGGGVSHHDWQSFWYQVRGYAERAAVVAALHRDQVDVIHAHDMLTFYAGMLSKQASGKPLIVHVHATSFDQCGGDQVDPAKYAIELQAFGYADGIIAISQHVKDTLVQRHGVDPAKVTVVHNGIDALDNTYNQQCDRLDQNIPTHHKKVLYLGRMTIQKGVDNFVKAALKTLHYQPDTTFILVGDGDLLPQIRQMVAESGFSDHFVFTGWVQRDQANYWHHHADVFVMPSVSEPFGLVPLEAALHNTPTIISKQSGVSEVFNHCLQVDFWDVDRMADQMIGLLRHQVLAQTMTNNGKSQSQQITWHKAAQKCMAYYDEVINIFKYQDT